MDADIKQIIDNTLRMESEAIAEILNNYNPEAVQKTVEAITGCTGRIVATGCGTSGEAAKKIVHTLSCVERPAFFLSPADALHGGLGAVQRDDIVLLLSKGGQTGELTTMIPSIKAKGALIIGVTENDDSPIAKQSDIYLKVKISKEPDEFNLLATSSIVAVIALFDAITIAVMRKTGFSREQFALIHPGGAVGVKLTGKVLFDE